MRAGIGQRGRACARASVRAGRINDLHRLGDRTGERNVRARRRQRGRTGLWIAVAADRIDLGAAAPARL
jgi:hypothetical protein